MDVSNFDKGTNAEAESDRGNDEEEHGSDGKDHTTDDLTTGTIVRVSTVDCRRLGVVLGRRGQRGPALMKRVHAIKVLDTSLLVLVLAHSMVIRR